MPTLHDTPKVWIACLAAYNEGHLHGKWVDATDENELHEAAQEIIKTSPAHFAEEIAIHDYDGFGNLSSKLGEYPSFAQVAAIGALIDEHGDRFLAFLEACEVDLSEHDELEDKFNEAYQGEADSEKDYAYEYIESCGWAGLDGQQIQDSSLYNYLDMDAIATELFQHGPYSLESGYVFNTYIH